MMTNHEARTLAYGILEARWAQVAAAEGWS